ncbi:MAG: arginine repressor [Gemmatimonadetes bacterium]|nr:arginine repressor [Gemmatimonadota bacterium]MBL0179772.1 arginine repressor [Gemmatimonadota bacterium]
MSLERRKRHLKILELVATRPMRTQDELAEALSQEGWEVTQSSVSRDISTLGLIKVEGIYQRAAASRLREIADPNERRLAESLLAVDPAGDALLVLHTPPGEAQRVGSALDLLGWPEVVGTLAGDDTIFVATRNASSQGTIQRRLNALMDGRS